MISNHVEDIIVAIREMPNGIWRNKALSHAHDALAALRMAEMSIDSSENLKAAGEAVNGLRTQEQRSTVCNCPAGGIRTSCPVHGTRV